MSNSSFLNLKSIQLSKGDTQSCPSTVVCKYSFCWELKLCASCGYCNLRGSPICRKKERETRLYKIVKK
jgi:hypothetical protein